MSSELENVPLDTDSANGATSASTSASDSASDKVMARGVKRKKGSRYAHFLLSYAGMVVSFEQGIENKRKCSFHRKFWVTNEAILWSIRFCPFLESDLSDDESTDGFCCPICLDPWTNGGDHRLSSLKCGHFFGQSCIERWLKGGGGGGGCPNCNEKASKKDVRIHFLAKLTALDTAERDRAVQQMEKAQAELRKLQLEHTTLRVSLKK